MTDQVIIGNLHLYDGYRQMMAEILVTKYDTFVSYTFIATYGMLALYQQNPNNPIAPPGSPIRYDAGGMLKYLADIAGHVPQEIAWKLDGQIRNERVEVLLPSTGVTHDMMTATVERLAALLHIPPDKVRQYMANHLTFKDIQPCNPGETSQDSVNEPNPHPYPNHPHPKPPTAAPDAQPDASPPAITPATNAPGVQDSA